MCRVKEIDSINDLRENRRHGWRGRTEGRKEKRENDVLGLFITLPNQ